MNDQSKSLKEVDKVEIVALIDNYVDLLLPSTEIVSRPILAEGKSIKTDTLLAEHGLSMLITVHQGEASHTILFDTGYSPIGVPHNIKMMGIEIDDIEAIVMSHGHMDHTGSLYAVLNEIEKPIPLVLHPDVFSGPRYFGLEDGTKLRFPQTIAKDELCERKIQILESEHPLLIAEDMIMVTGEVEHTTDFEKGLPNALVERDGALIHDPIADDQALVMKLKEKGLVIVSGCAHSGIVNTVYYAQKVTGEQEVNTIMGGFHLTGPHFEPIIGNTVEALRDINPEVLVPMHCTGWKAIERFSEAFPRAFILNSVGSKYTLS